MEELASAAEVLEATAAGAWSALNPSELPFPTANPDSYRKSNFSCRLIMQTQTTIAKCHKENNNRKKIHESISTQKKIRKIPAIMPGTEWLQNDYSTKK